jgi:OmpA-OmpF porin, OOP family
MKKYLQVLIVLLLSATVSFAQSDFIPGGSVIFEDDFSRDALGDFPAKWSTSGEGAVVTLDGVPGKWLRIAQPTAVSPELKKALPENCTIEFDLYMKTTGGVAPLIMFGLTSLSDVSAGDVYRRHISVKMRGYNKSGSILYARNIQKLGEKKFPLEGYVERVMHISIAVNKTRWRVYLDDQKVIDLPKLLTPDYRKNFFVASSVILPSPEEGVYISNVRIAGGEADARSLLVKQLMEQGSAVTGDIQFNSQTNQITPESEPVIDQLGKAMLQNPGMSIQINSVEEVPSGNDNVSAGESENNSMRQALKMKADKIKAYLVNKFRLKKDRIVTDAKVKIADVEKNRTVTKARSLLTEFIKL